MWKSRNGHLRGSGGHNFFNDAGVSVGSLYPGVIFGPYVTGLSVTRFGGYNSAGFPPHSGDVVVWSAFDSEINITFEATQAFVGFWYTSLDPIALLAYDSGSNLLGSATGAPNTDGFFGVSSYLQVISPGVASVTISGAAGQYVIDDLSHGTVVIPEPSWVIPLAGLLWWLSLRARHRRNGAATRDN